MRFTTRLMLFLSLFVFSATPTARADFIVEQGFDLFQSQTSFFNFGGILGIQAFESNPLGTFDFGGTIGVQNTGATDTIVQRTSTADTGGVPGTDNVAIEIVALSLQSVTPLPLFGPAEFILVTLDSDTGGNNMDIQFDDPNGGNFQVQQLQFDMLFTGQTSLNTVTVNALFTSGPTPWRHDPPTGPAIIGVNRFLKGPADAAQDFWTVGPLTLDDGGGTVHIVENPEPSALILFAAATAVTIRRRRRGTRS